MKIKSIKNVHTRVTSKKKHQFCPLYRKFSYEAQKSGRAKNYKLWQDGFHPVILDTLEKMEQRVNYIHYNPVEAEIVFHERDYVNSSYRNYEEDNSVFCNVHIEPLW